LDQRGLAHVVYGFDFALWRDIDDFAHDLFNWLAIGAAVLVHFFRFAPTAIEQDCGSRDAVLRTAGHCRPRGGGHARLRRELAGVRGRVDTLLSLPALRASAMS